MTQAMILVTNSYRHQYFYCPECAIDYAEKGTESVSTEVIPMYSGGAEAEANGWHRVGLDWICPDCWPEYQKRKVDDSNHSRRCD